MLSALKNLVASIVLSCMVASLALSKVEAAPKLPAMVRVTNIKVPTLTILPGGTGKVLAAWDVTAVGGQPVRFTDFSVMSDLGINRITSTVTEIKIKADSNGKGRDGCEDTIGYADIDQVINAVDIRITRPPLFRAGKTLRVQLEADFYLWMAGDAISLKLSEAKFTGQRNNPVADNRIRYTGVQPVLHTLRSDFLSLFQWTDGEIGIAVPGQQDVPVLRFWAAPIGTTVAVRTEFVALQGSLENVRSFTLLADRDWDDVMEVVQADIWPNHDGTLVFYFIGEEDRGSNYEIRADMADAFVSGSFQLGFTNPNDAVMAVDMDTGEPLQGLRFNGSGEGQVQYDARPDQATVFTLIP